MLGILSIIFVTFLWASVLLISSIVNLPSPLFVFLRLLFSMLVVIPFGMRAENKKFSVLSMLSGLLISFNWIFLFYAVEIIGPSTADFLYYSAPVIALFIARLTGTVIPKIGWISAILSFSGVGLIYGFSGANPKGVIFALLGALFYGSVVVLGKHITQNIDPYFFTMNQLVVATIVTLPFATPHFHLIAVRKLLFSAVAGVLNTGIALLLWWKALKYVNIHIASVLTYLDPLFALVLSMFFLGFKPTIWNVLGGVLILSGGVLVTLLGKEKN